MPEPSLKDLLNVASDAAYLAGRRALAYFNTPLEVENKADDSPVTRADREAEVAIRDLISHYFPTHSLLGEEFGNTVGDPDYKWIIDPIDGTKAFIHGVPLFGTLIGVEVRGKPRVGVIYLPAINDMLTGAEGLGAYWNGRPARVSTISKLSESTLLAGSITRALNRSDAYEKLEKQVRLNRGWGDCFGYFLVATGRAEIMLDPRTTPWDCSPYVPILKEAGGRFSTWAGDETIYGPDAVATNGLMHETVLGVLKAEKRRM